MTIQCPSKKPIINLDNILICMSYLELGLSKSNTTQRAKIRSAPVCSQDDYHEYHVSLSSFVTLSDKSTGFWRAVPHHATNTRYFNGLKYVACLASKCNTCSTGARHESHDTPSHARLQKLAQHVNGVHPKRLKRGHLVRCNCIMADHYTSSKADFFMILI